MTDALARDHFAPHINSIFQSPRDEKPAVNLELVEVSDLRRTSGSEAFSLVFRGPLDAPLPQAMHRLRHDIIGAFDLFIVPIGRDQQGFYYEAVFNRLRLDERR